MKTDKDKTPRASSKKEQAHKKWDFAPVFVSDPATLPAKREAGGGVDVRSICGGIDESQPVEQYDGTLGVPVEFVRRHERSTGQVQWNNDLYQRYRDPGSVNNIRWASGTLIGRDLFLTAGHAFDPFPGIWRVPRQDGTDKPIPPEEIATNMRVNFNYQVAPTGELRREESFPVLELLEYRLGGLDYAIVRLGGQPGDKYGFVQLAREDSRDGDMLCIIQHPEGQPKRIHAGRQVHTHDARLGYDTIDTLGGSSGAGILEAAGGRLVGVHTHGGCDVSAVGHNHGYRLGAIADVSAVVKRLLAPGWVHRDLHRLTDAPAIKSAPSCYATPGGLHIIYRNGPHIHELRRAASWQHYAISAGDKMPAAQGNPTGYALFGNRTRYVSFLGRDRHIHQLWWDGEWRHIDVSAEAGAPDAGGEPAPHISFDGNSQQLYFTGADGNLYLLWWGGRWHHANLSAATDAAPATGRPAVTSTGRDQRIFVAYTGQDGHIHLLEKEQTTWRSFAAGAEAHAPAATSSPRATLLLGDDKPRIYYQSRDGHIIKLYWSAGRWLHRNLSVAARAPLTRDEPAVAVAPDASFATVLMRSRDGHIIQLEGRDTWQATDLSTAANAPDSRSTPAGVILYPSSHRYVVFRGEDDHLHEISWEE